MHDVDERRWCKSSCGKPVTEAEWAFVFVTYDKLFRYPFRPGGCEHTHSPVLEQDKGVVITELNVCNTFCGDAEHFAGSRYVPECA
jgi:hypothetical protein